MNGFYSSRNQTANSNTLGNASQGNVSKKQGVYSKFRNKVNLTKSLSTSQNNPKSTPRDQNRFEVPYPEIGLRQNETFEQPLPSTSRTSGLRKNETLFEQSQPSTCRTRDLSGISMRDEGPTLTLGINQSRAKNDLNLSYSRSPVKNGQDSPLRDNENLGPELSPRVVLKRIPEFDGIPANRPVGLKRDPDGFLIPGAPLNDPKFKIEQEKRISKKDLSELTDNMPSVEAFYYLKKFEELLESSLKKINPLLNGYINNSLLGRERKLQVIDWLQSTNNSEAPLPVPTSVTSAILQDYAASVVSARPKLPANQQWNKEIKAVYSLGDWTIVKGKAPIEVMVSGELMDINNETVKEEGHISSRILSADGVVVQTSCCIYQLSGEFVDPSGCIPSSIKKYFQNGKFPKEWKEVIRMWSILKDRENSLCNPGNNNRITYDEPVSDVDDGRRTRLRESERLPDEVIKRGLDRFQSTGVTTRFKGIKDQRTSVRDDQRVLNREDQRIQGRENQRSPQRVDQRFQGREYEAIHDREVQRMLNREDQRIRDREGQRIQDRKDPRSPQRVDQRFQDREYEITRNREVQRIQCQSINGTCVDDDWMKDRPEKDESRVGGRVLFQQMDRLQDTDDEANTRDRQVLNFSRLKRKRKGISETKEESVSVIERKKRKVDNVFHGRVQTPGMRQRTLTILTRSARKKMDSYICTPKSSKRNPLKSRIKTPMPPRRGRIAYDSVASYDNSDLM